MNGGAWPELFAPPIQPNADGNRRGGAEKRALRSIPIEYSRDNAHVYTHKESEGNSLRVHEAPPNDIRNVRRRKSELSEKSYFLVLLSYRKSATKKEEGKNEAALLLPDFRYRSRNIARSVYYYSTKYTVAYHI